MTNGYGTFKSIYDFEDKLAAFIPDNDQRAMVLAYLDMYWMRNWKQGFEWGWDSSLKYAKRPGD